MPIMPKVCTRVTNYKLNPCFHFITYCSLNKIFVRLRSMFFYGLYYLINNSFPIPEKHLKNDLIHAQSLESCVCFSWYKE